MVSLSRESVLSTLSNVPDSRTGKDVVSAGLITGVVVRGAQVGFLLNVPPSEASAYEGLRAACERAVAELPGVEKVTAVLTAESQDTSVPKEPQKAAQWNRTPIAGVKHVIAVASGKGGVGKSTTTVCLAHALRGKGLKVGILDADIYGPSIPLMLGISDKPELDEKGQMLPLEKDGLASVSIGYILGDEAAIMRAPMVTKALSQLLRGVNWGELDVLLVDMPPGTGDIHLSMVQQAPLSGAIVVTTPQQVAAIDAHKAVQMFRKVAVPVFGIVENMSYLDANGAILHPFGKGGGEKLAKEMAAPFLGEVPLLPALGAALDKGAMVEIPDKHHEIATHILQQLKI